MVISKHQLPQVVTVLTTLLLAFPACAQENSSGYAIQSSSTPIPLSSEDPDEIRVGALTYRGGVEIQSPDENFGGLSGLLVSPDLDRFLAVTDKGAWVRGRLVIEQGKLKAVRDLELASIQDTDGDLLLGKKKKGDAESLTGIWSEGADNPSRVFVSFEQKHRIEEYDFGAQGFNARPKPRLLPKKVDKASHNSGLESVEWDGTEADNLLAFVEEPFKGKDTIAGWFIGKDDAFSLKLVPHGSYKMTDLGRLPNGDYLTLERRFSPIGGVGAEIRHLPAASITPGAHLDGEVLAQLAPPHSVDNMEGMSVRQDKEGRVLIFIVSDDNFNPLQRTILLMFELKDETP
ncbi:MAG: hypothetical protein EP347_12790 [Alphaproteobacteria bacterium]|nr:MAG: hypothetical protein EP347_12790 [Alphaproteobacteria bacterium]